MMKADLIIDLQYGSTGKGLIAGWLAKENGYDTVVNANMPNAGHTFIDITGRTWVHKVLPNGIVSPNLRRVMIGPGSVFSVDRFLWEMQQSEDLLANVDVMIHPDAVPLKDEHASIEGNMLSGISSTMQGSAAAMVEKIWRQYPLVTARHDSRVRPWICTNQQWIYALWESERMLIEGAQGYSLGINAGFYPFCTSRDCTPARFLADCAVPLPFLDRVIGTARVHPIRVGNTTDGTSGGYYEDQEEITWESLGIEPEKTTVTGRNRRVFTFSEAQMEDAIAACQPHDVFLNFCNYDEVLARRIRMKIDGIMEDMSMVGGQVAYTGHGATEGDIRTC